MPRTLAKILAVLAAIVMTGVTAATPAQAGTEAYFRFSDSHGAVFTFQLRDGAQIEQARRILSGEETDAVHVKGTIVKAPASYNPGWSYHLDPGTISFFGVAAEVCDASVQYVEDHLDEVGGAFLPGNVWCPWSSRLIAEIEPA